jgi:hypothetical protein
MFTKGSQASPDHRPSMALQPTAVFSYTPMTTVRYATPLPSPLSYQPYAAPFASVSHLAGDPTYTTYSYIHNATVTDTNEPYGQGAYRALWGTTTFTDQLPFTTTVSPTPVASSGLISPLLSTRQTKKRGMEIHPQALCGGLRAVPSSMREA